jgi:hypothetical protein
MTLLFIIYLTTTHHAPLNGSHTWTIVVKMVVVGVRRVARQVQILICFSTVNRRLNLESEAEKKNLYLDELA